MCTELICFLSAINLYTLELPGMGGGKIVLLLCGSVKNFMDSKLVWYDSPVAKLPDCRLKGLRFKSKLDENCFCSKAVCQAERVKYFFTLFLLL